MKLATPRGRQPKRGKPARRKSHPPARESARGSLRLELAAISDAHGPASLKDIPRLIKRTRIHAASGQGKPAVVVYDGLDPETQQSPIPSCVCDALTALTRHFHGNERAEAAQAQMRALLAHPDTPADSQEAVTMLLAPHIEAVTPEWCVLRHLNQSVVLAALSRMYEDVLKGVLVKDVKGAEGWTVDVLAGRETVKVTHTRRERSVAVHGRLLGGEHGHWDLVWEVSQTLSARADRTTAAFVRVVRLDFAEFKGPSHDRFALQAALPSGLIVC